MHTCEDFMKNRNIGSKRTNLNTNTLKLDISDASYAGLTISKRTNASNEANHEKILIAKWVRPDWSETPLLKLDFPQMGYVSYSEGSPP